MDLSGPSAGVQHDAQRRQFLLLHQGLRCELDYQLATTAAGRQMIIHHTGVPAALRGQGLAERLARAALDHALAEGYVVVPQCSYIARFIERHQDYRERLRGAAPS